ncbi:MAG: ribulose-phosphate 3-epimerase [Phycisphaeraceae bacterium]|nr:MAG: ribulose-phosphate 3-epimerase [Phycisphaeraceae bacterium]
MPNLFRDPPRLPLVAPSILSADFARMEADCRTVLDGPPDDPGVADLLHLDVMDGHFVPNLTMGPDLCRALRRAFPSAMLDVHLMVTDPAQYISPFRDAGADHLTFHIEPATTSYRAPTGAGGGPSGAGYDPAEIAQKIHDAGMTAGLAINPPTPVDAILPHLEPFELILVMSVNPGYSGQSFIESALSTTRALRAKMAPNRRLQMDGGVNPTNAARVREAGCDVLVAASAVFGLPESARHGAIAGIRG